MCLQNGAYPSTISDPTMSSSLTFERKSEVFKGMRGPIWLASNCLKQNASRPMRTVLDVLIKRTNRVQQNATSMEENCLIPGVAAEFVPSNSMTM